MDTIRRLAVTATFLSVFIVSVYSQGPSDVTVIVGGTATFECVGATVQGWILFPDKKLVDFAADGTAKYFSSRYTVTATKGLVLTNVALEDANTFQCKTSVASDYFANLVVLGSFILPTILPIMPQLLGSSIAIGCSLTYSEPNNTQRPITGQDPVVMMYVGPNTVATTVTSVVTVLGSQSIRTVTANFTLTSSQGGQPVLCTATSGSVTLQSSNITLPYAPNVVQTNISAATSNTYFSLTFGNVINCSANGYPLPVVHWIPLNRSVTGGNLLDSANSPGWALLSFTMPSVGMWNCSASNSLYIPPTNITYTLNVQSQSSYPQLAAGNIVRAVVLAMLSLILKNISSDGK